MESVITVSGLGTQRNSGAAFSSAAPDSHLASPTKLTDRLSSLVINEEGKTRFPGGSSGLSLFSPQGLEWITEKTGSDELSRFIYTLATNVQTYSDKTTTELYRLRFASEREPLPPKHIADRYVDYFFESYNNLFLLYHKASFDQSYEFQYSGQPPSCPACIHRDANLLIHAAAVKGPESHGEYMSEGKIKLLSDLVLRDNGAKLQKKLWDETEAVLKKRVPSTEDLSDIFKV